MNHLLHGGALVQRMRVLRALTLHRDMLWHISNLVGIHSLVEEGCGRVEGHASVIVWFVAIYLALVVCES